MKLKPQLLALRHPWLVREWQAGTGSVSRLIESLKKVKEPLCLRVCLPSKAPGRDKLSGLISGFVNGTMMSWVWQSSAARSDVTSSISSSMALFDKVRGGQLCEQRVSNRAFGLVLIGSHGNTAHLDWEQWIDRFGRMWCYLVRAYTWISFTGVLNLALCGGRTSSSATHLKKPFKNRSIKTWLSQTRKISKGFNLSPWKQICNI